MKHRNAMNQRHPSPAMRLLPVLPLALPALLGGCGGGDAAGAGAADEAAPATSPASGGAKGEVRLSADAIERYGVRVEPAQERVLVPTFVVPARVSFDREAMAEVGSSVAGRVVEVTARLGDSVASGQELLVIQSPDLAVAQSDFLERRIAEAVAKTAVEPLRVAYERGKQLYDSQQGAISLADVQQREAELQAAKGQVTAAEAATSAARNRLVALGMSGGQIGRLIESNAVDDRLAVTAPISGRVVDRAVVPGEQVGPGTAALMTLADTSTLWVIADVPQAQVERIGPGAKATVTVGTASEQTVEREVSYIGAELDPQTRTAPVRIVVVGGGSGLRPGMFVQAEIEAADPAAAPPEPILAVPEDAVLIVGGEQSVFAPVAGEDGTFRRRPVATGPTVGGMVPILSGLKAGDPVVVDGSFILKAELGKGAADDDD